MLSLINEVLKQEYNGRKYELYGAKIYVEIPSKAFIWRNFTAFMTNRITTRLPKLIMESQEYKFIKQAVIVSKRVLPSYPSKFSKKYKQYQLFVILLYKFWVNASYRDVIEYRLIQHLSPLIPLWNTLLRNNPEVLQEDWHKSHRVCL